jgi:hypothetical protein
MKNKRKKFFIILKKIQTAQIKRERKRFSHQWQHQQQHILHKHKVEH